MVITFLNDAIEDNILDSDIDPIEALRGCRKGSNLIEKLLGSRREDKDLEESKWKK